jgi:hypothetical protein
MPWLICVTVVPPYLPAYYEKETCHKLWLLTLQSAQTLFCCCIRFAAVDVSLLLQHHSTSRALSSAGMICRW